MKTFFSLLALIILAQVLFAQTGTNKAKYPNEDKQIISVSATGLQLKSLYLAQATPTLKLQGEGAAVPAQEGKTETESVWTNKGLWIAIIAILIVVYISRRKKQ